jgi:hypothetical protein
LYPSLEEAIADIRRINQHCIWCMVRAIGVFIAQQDHCRAVVECERSSHIIELIGANLEQHIHVL